MSFTLNKYNASSLLNTSINFLKCTTIVNHNDMKIRTE